jgi:hypothetical protein
MTTLDIHQRGTPFDAESSILAQVGWVGHRAGDVYSLLDMPLGDGREPGGVSPLYIIVGRYVRDEEGNKLWED